MKQYFKNCLYCGDEFITNNWRTKYCSKACRILKQAETIKKRQQLEEIGRRLKAKIKENEKQQYQERVRLSKTTDVHYGIITAYWNDKEQLKKIIAYEQKIGRAKPMKLEEKRKVGW